MHRIGILNSEKNFYSQKIYKTMMEQNWDIVNLAAEKANDSKLDALIISEETTEVTCSQLVNTIHNKYSDIPVYVLLNSNNQEDNSLIYLFLGAEICFTYESKEELVVLNIDRLLRKRNYCLQHRTKPLGENQIELHEETLSVILNNELEIQLTRLEYKTLQILYQNKNKAVTYNEMLDELRKGVEKPFAKHRITNCMFHLRKKFEGIDEVRIQVVRTVGYKLVLG